MHTGLYDSEGVPIHIKSRLKQTVEINQDVHGSWALFEVKMRGLIPVLSYVCSERGQVLPVGMTGCALSDIYDTEAVCGDIDLSQIRPVETWLVTSG